jgi:hypothetical protein
LTVDVERLEFLEALVAADGFARLFQNFIRAGVVRKRNGCEENEEK